MGELPALKALGERFADELVIFGVNTDPDPAEYRARAESFGVTWPNVLAGSRQAPVLNEWAVRAFPTVFVLDREQRLVAKGVRGEALAEIVAELVAKPAERQASSD